MISCSRNETKLIQEGRASSLTRMEANPNPYQSGSQVVLTSRYVGGDGETPFAIATVVSVRPTTVQEMMREPRLCSMDGFESPAVWHGHFRTRYPGIGDAARLMRLQLRIDEMDKDVAERLMGGSAAEPEHERVFVD